MHIVDTVILQVVQKLLDEKWKNVICCTLYVVYAMYTACYTVHTTQYLAYYIYCIAANFELVQIFAYFVLNFTVQK